MKRKDKKFYKPPIFAEWIFKLYFPDKGSYSTLGDLNEVYNYKLQTEGKFKVKIWYWLQLYKSIIPIIKHTLTWGIEMYLNYLTIGIRNLFKHKVFSVINITGLSIGLTCTILIFLYVNNEFSFDTFHKKSDRIYQVITHYNNNSGQANLKATSLSLIMGPEIKEYFPEVDNVIRIIDDRILIGHKNNVFKEKMTFTDKNFFEVLSFPLLVGDPSAILKQNNGIVLSRSTAEKLFGNENPTGKDVQLTYGDGTLTLTVTGIAEDPPPNSSINFSCVTNLNIYRAIVGNEFYENRGNFIAKMYLLLKNGVDEKNINSRFDNYTKKYYASLLDGFRSFMKIDKDKLPLTFRIENIENVHLDSSINGSADATASYTLMAIALIVLIIASINFMNLSVGRASTRFKEIGIRKVLGADKKQLINQFWSESILITFVSIVFGLLIAAVLLPQFNQITDKNLSMAEFWNVKNISFLIAMIFGVGIIVGSYPAYIMSRFSPSETFKGNIVNSKKRSISKLLIVIQFGLSVFLIISTFILTSQIDYMLTKDLGYNDDGVIVVDLQNNSDEMVHRLVENYKNVILDYPDVINAAGTSAPFGGENRSSSYIHYMGNRVLARRFNVDEDFLRTMQIELLKGRNFSSEFSTDSSAALINETFVKEMALTDPIGKEIKLSDKIPFKIIGVVKDFYSDPVKDKLNPAILISQPNRSFGGLMVRINKNNISASLNFLKEKWEEVSPGKPFLYSFLDNDLENYYKKDKQWRSIVLYSSLFSLIIAGMGIFGLTLISVNKRKKELSIRKVLGANIFNVTSIIVKEFTILVLIANLIAWPAAYFAMKQILENYYYRIPITINYFIVAGIISFFVALLTTGYLTYKTAVANPVDALRNE